MNDDIDIVYILDDSYWIPVFVSAKSAILCHVGEELDKRRLKFHFLVDGVSYNHRSRLLNELTTAVSSVEIMDVDMTIFSDMPEWHGSKLVWTRCKLNQLLPNLSSWTCICDGDTLWFKDPSILFDAVKRLDERVVLAGSVDYISSDESSSDFFFEKGLSCPNKNYVCLGFAMINMGKLRGFEIDKKAKSFISKYGMPPWFEQDVFNYVLRNHKERLPIGWGVSPVRGVKLCGGNVAVIHYYGSLPWPASVTRRMLDVHIPWWYLARELCVTNEGEFKITFLLFVWMRMITIILQFMPNRLLWKIHHSTRQTPFHYKNIIKKYASILN